MSSERAMTDSDYLEKLLDAKFEVTEERLNSIANSVARLEAIVAQQVETQANLIRTTTVIEHLATEVHDLKRRDEKLGEEIILLRGQTLRNSIISGAVSFAACAVFVAVIGKAF